MKISKISAYEIIASGGYPSLEAKVTLDSGVSARASVPYGASAGTHEAAVLVDGDKSRYHGKGMLSAVGHVNGEIRDALLGKEADPAQIDKIMNELDGTENKSRLGGNAILAVSLAAARARAKAEGKPFYKFIADNYQTGVELDSGSKLPQPMVVVIEGGKHAHNSTDLQEYCFAGIADTSVAENLRAILESYHELKKILKENGLSTNVGNEGAFAPEGIASNEAPFEFMVEAIKRAGYEPGKDIGISIDAAASEFYHNGNYELKLEGRTLSSSELSAYYQTWMEKYPIITLEDMHHEDDWAAWTEFLEICTSHKVELIGDDLTVTNPKRLERAIQEKAINSILIKLNQIGTLSETVETCKLAKQNQFSSVTSHRGGGETNDTAMVDTAVAVGSRFIKVGPTRGERVSKYNRLLEIERELKN